MLMVFCDNKVKAILVKAHNGTLPEFQKLLSEKDMTRLCFFKSGRPSPYETPMPTSRHKKE